MDKLRMAQEAHSLGIQFNRLQDAQRENYGAYVEDGMARLASFGFKLGDVIEAGICRLGRIPASMIKSVRKKPESAAFVTTDNWREEIEIGLTRRADYIDWKDRTFLEIMLIEGNLSAGYLAAIERVLVDAYVQEWLAEEEWAESLDQQAPPPGEQFSFDV